MEYTGKKNFKCVIDFVELQIETESSTNAQTIRRKINLPYVQPLNKDLGAAATKFKFRIYDISKWYELKKIYDLLNQNFKLKLQPVIKAIEVSFDTYMPEAKPYEFIEQTAHYFQMLKNPPSDNVRLAGKGKGSVNGIVSFRQIANELNKGKSLYIGSQKPVFGKTADGISMRLYSKTTDREIALPSSEHRVRVEVTLQGEACPFTTLEEAQNYNFARLSKYFLQNKVRSYREPNEFLTRLPQLGKRNPVPRRDGGGYKFFKQSVAADIEINQIIYNKLRELTIRLRPGRPRELRVRKSYYAGKIGSTTLDSINYIH